MRVTTTICGRKEFFSETVSVLMKPQNELTAQINEYAYSAQNLGFVQGMNFALDIMRISGKDENREVLEKIIESIEKIGSKEQGE
ncbi:MAG: hypothetical protein L6V87_04575 [Ruminococcus sp.]|nr:MAG: hypothetical protein L6V87_04575 [Ruminococcus sp.]